MENKINMKKNKKPGPFVWKILNIDGFVIICKLNTGEVRQIDFNDVFREDPPVIGSPKYKLLNLKNFSKIETGQYYFMWPNITEKTKIGSKHFDLPFTMDIGELKKYFK